MHKVFFVNDNYILVPKNRYYNSVKYRKKLKNRTLLCSPKVRNDYSMRNFKKNICDLEQHTLKNFFILSDVWSVNYNESVQSIDNKDKIINFKKENGLSCDVY